MANPFKRCGCGKAYTYAEWKRLPFRGFQIDDVEAQEMRNCTCGSSITIDAVRAGLTHKDADLVRRTVDSWRHFGLRYREIFMRYQDADPLLELATFDAWLEDPVS